MAPGRRRDPADPTRTILVALAGNLVIAAAKFAGAAATGSGAMAAEGFHSLADSGIALAIRARLRIPAVALGVYRARRREFATCRRQL